MSEQQFWDFLMQWGYLAIFLAVFIEGELFLIMIGIATAATVFSYPLAIMAAFLGAVCHDNLILNISKLSGRKIIDKKPTWQEKVDKSLRLLDKYDYWAILSIRFLYGLRTITILVVGLSEIKRLKFLAFDAISSLVWSFIYISLGFFSGHAVLNALSHLHLKVWMKEHEGLTFFIILILSLIGVVLYRTYKIYLNYRVYKRLKREVDE